MMLRWYNCFVACFKIERYVNVILAEFLHSVYYWPEIKL